MNNNAGKGLSRGWIEFIGVILLTASVAGLALLSGLAPILTMPRATMGDMAIRLVVIALIGTILLVMALRQEGRKWHHIVVVPMVIVAVALAVIFIPLWAYFSYLEASNPFEYIRLVH